MSKERFLFPILFQGIWSGRRELNPRPKRWQRFALPLSYSRVFKNYTSRQHNPEFSTFFNTVAFIKP